MTTAHRKEYWRKYVRQHRDRINKNSRTYYSNVKDKLFTALGRSCKKCGFDDTRALQVDHINGGGSKARKFITTLYYKFVLDKIVEGSLEYQLLCANCNWIKKHERNEK